MKLLRQIAWTVYEAAMCLVWPVLYFYYFCRSRTDGKYGDNYLNRMGLKLPAFLPPRSGRVWIHALSMGEALSSIALIAELKQLRPALEIVFSTSTETGMTLASERLKRLADGFFYMPHDFPWTVCRLLERISPSLFVLIETDFRPNLLRRLGRLGVPAALVNGRVSPGSYRSFYRLGRLASLVFGGFGLIFTQTALDRERFISMGCPPQRVVAAGNLKFDSSLSRVPDSQIAEIGAGIGLEAGRPVWVAGSTHEGEEQILLRIHGRLSARTPNLLLIIAPRQIQRGSAIAALSHGFGFETGLRSKGETAAGKQVYILDTLGELARIYAVCHIAFLGGSFAAIGGHNPLEAVAQGRPACWGPHFFNFAEIERELLDAGCAMKVSCERELEDFLEKTLIDAAEIAKMTLAARNFASSQKHTASRIASLLLEEMG